MIDIKKVRALLRQGNPVTAGKEGERFAEQWMFSNNWVYEKVEQGVGTKSIELCKMGGKRPDYILEVDARNFIALDAKYVTTENNSIFMMTDYEIHEYHQLQIYLEKQFLGFNFEVVFIVFPKENVGEKLVFVSLDYFTNAVSCNVSGFPGKAVKISDLDNLWFGHIPEYE